jgi:predicted DNA binding CopG/RHH family protein
MDKKDLEKLPRKNLLPGYESGRYEPVREYDRTEFRSHPMDDVERRDNRVSIRISGSDLNRLRSIALSDGVPVQSLIAGIIHRFVSENLSGTSGSTVELAAALPPLINPVVDLPVEES